MDIIKPGDIRKPIKFPKGLMKVTMPFDIEMHSANGEIAKGKSYILTNDFPDFHRVIIDHCFNSCISPNPEMCIVYLLTHHIEYFDNLKVTSDLYNISSIRSPLNLSDSYITRDRFLVYSSNIGKQVFGNFYIEKLRSVLEY